jgi:hypothetical protein
VTVTDRAQKNAQESARENREHVRTLLRKKQPEFAALLDWLELLDWLDLNFPCLSGRDTMCAESAADRCS